MFGGVDNFNQKKGRKFSTAKHVAEWAEVDSKVIAAVTGAVFAIQLPVPPSLNKRLVPMMIPRNGRPSATLVRSSEATKYQKLVRSVAENGLFGSDFKMFDGPLEAHAVWIRARAVGDADGRWKDVFDALQGLVYINDEQITRYIYDKDDGDKANARIVISIYPRPKVREQQDLFK